VSQPFVKLVPTLDRPDPEAPLTVEAAFRTNARYVNTLALRILGRSEDAEDLAQEIFISALSDLKDLSNVFRVRQWFATATIRAARRKLRRRRLFSFLEDEHEYELLAAVSASPEHRALLASIYALLDRLPTPQRLAWTLRHIEGMDLNTVAEHCGCSLATAKRRIAEVQAIIEAEISDE
jgi:RNA polymerase sigma-70 factor (ECF subfamily)